MFGRGRSCFYSCCCRSFCSPFLRWKQIARPALIMATEYSVRLRGNYEHPHGCLCCSLSDSTGFIHYLLDRSVYRMSDPKVRAAASGLIGRGNRISRTKKIQRLALVSLLALVSVCSVHAQIGTPAVPPQPPKAIYTPKPVYRPEWAKQGLAGKGVVLVTIDQQTGKVTGARMLQSTGNKQLDGAALEAYSQWRFQPGTGSQVKIPIEFASRPKPQVPKQKASQPAILYPLLILLGFGVAVIAMRTRRRSAR